MLSSERTGSDARGWLMLLLMTSDQWKTDVEQRAAEVEAQKVRLRLAVMALTDVLRNRPPETTNGGRLEVRERELAET